jgi:hypothetical protein
LHVAVAQGKPDIVRLLVERGVDIKAVDNVRQTHQLSPGGENRLNLMTGTIHTQVGRSLLHIAVENLQRNNGSIAMLEFLIDSGVDVNSLDAVQSVSPTHHSVRTQTDYFYRKPIGPQDAASSRVSPRSVPGCRLVSAQQRRK